MIDAFIGSMLLVAYNFIPKYWAECNGQSLQIAQYQELFSIVGNMYGGDAINNFNLPKMPEAKEWQLPEVDHLSQRSLPAAPISWPSHRGNNLTGAHLLAIIWREGGQGRKVTKV